MKSKDVIRILNISRPTLTNYVKQGYIKVKVLPSGRYDYDENSVYNFLNKGIPRKNFLYARVSTPSQKTQLEYQVQLLKQYCFNNGLKIDGVFTDIASGITFEKRNKFFELLDEVILGKVDKVIITYKDRLSRVGFDLFSKLFEHYGTQIIITSEVGSVKLDSEEIFEEIVSLLHCYSMKLYSKRRLTKLKELLQEKEEC